MNKSDLWTTDRLAKYLNCERRTIYHLTKRQQIPYIKLGKELRFDPEDVCFFLKHSNIKNVKKDDSGVREEFDVHGALSGLSA